MFVCISGISPAREPGDRVGVGRVIVYEQCEPGSVLIIVSISVFVIYKDITVLLSLLNATNTKQG